MPVQSVSLLEAVEEEGTRMHAINMALLQSMFREKKEMINQFIAQEYTPTMVENFKSQLPKDTDYKADFALMVQSLMPRINASNDFFIRTTDPEHMAKVAEVVQRQFSRGHQRCGRALGSTRRRRSSAERAAGHRSREARRPVMRSI